VAADTYYLSCFMSTRPTKTNRLITPLETKKVDGHEACCSSWRGTDAARGQDGSGRSLIDTKSPLGPVEPSTTPWPLIRTTSRALCQHGPRKPFERIVAIETKKVDGHEACCSSWRGTDAARGQDGSGPPRCIRPSPARATCLVTINLLSFYCNNPLKT
jgi:hypothetical protein